MDVARRLEVLEAENDALRAEIDALKRMFARSGIVPPAEFGLSPSEGRLFGLLLTRGQVCSRESIWQFLYGGFGGDADGGPDLKIIDVFICKMRAKMKPHDLVITTVWACGYRMEAASKDKAWAMMPGQQEARDGEASKGGVPTTRSVQPDDPG